MRGYIIPLTLLSAFRLFAKRSQLFKAINASFAGGMGGVVVVADPGVRSTLSLARV